MGAGQGFFFDVRATFHSTESGADSSFVRYSGLIIDRSVPGSILCAVQRGIHDILNMSRCIWWMSRVKKSFWLLRISCVSHVVRPYAEN